MTLQAAKPQQKVDDGQRLMTCPPTELVAGVAHCFKLLERLQELDFRRRNHRCSNEAIEP